MELTHGKFSDKSKKSDYYDLYPILKDFKRKKLIEENPYVYFVGGEPSVLKEFKDIVNLFLKYSPSEMNILSSGILYDKSIANALKHDNTNLIISMDAGTEETFKKIKRIDKLPTMIENIKKYMQASERAIDHVLIKYIIINNLNDTEEELEAFLKLAKSTGTPRIRLDIEFCRGCNKKKGQPIPQKIYDLVNYATNKADELELGIDSTIFVSELLKRGHY